MGADGLKSLEYSGSGVTFAFGQSAAPGQPWPRLNLKSFTRSVNYETASLRDENVARRARTRCAAAASGRSGASSVSPSG